ncbi:MAG: hypothetical protein KatS3mg057_1548 [Herpetosiphonaceae bacterium]|nr:MAG: hypothetical protein KatS3mg057_1548 [Herpetosiphonaceae bacterium]
MQRTRYLLGAIVMLATIGGLDIHDDQAAFAQHTLISWQEDLTAAPERSINVVNVADGLTLGHERLRALSLDLERHYGMLTTPARTLDWPIDSIRAILRASVPPKTKVQVDVRGRTADGVWTEWQIARETAPALLPMPVYEVQVRITLLDDGRGNLPVVHQLDIIAERMHTATEASPQVPSPLTFTVYATREGLVGHTTANGHRITPYDRFVALPSHRALCAVPRNPCEYMVELYYPRTGRRVQAPVWDVGPWNTNDDYWNPPWIRQMWNDLPQGIPQAQAAYEDDYNGGMDQFGRMVSNPAGIDLADGTFWLDLGMTHNDWIQVTYLWTSGGGLGWEAIVDNTNIERFSASGGWVVVNWDSQDYDTGYHLTTPQATSDPAWFKLSIPENGPYEIYVWYPAHPDYNASTPYIVKTGKRH